MDREDWLYLSGCVLVSAGFGWWYPPSALVCLGSALVFWPFVARVLMRGGS